MNRLSACLPHITHDPILKRIMNEEGFDVSGAAVDPIKPLTQPLVSEQTAAHILAANFAAHKRAVQTRLKSLERQRADVIEGGAQADVLDCEINKCRRQLAVL